MIELPLIFIGGLLGSSHCIGMCGSFAASIGVGSHGLSHNFRRQLVYSLGRLFTYAFLGGAAGFIGLRLTGKLSHLVQVQAVLSLLAGAALIVQGLHSVGWLRWPTSRPQSPPCLSQSLFTPFLAASRWYNPLIAGLLTGFLPCGLVYAYLALAASTRDLFSGMAVMALFGAGTVPLMVLAGLGASFLTVAVRGRVLKWAACCVIITGALATSRGLWFAAHSGTGNTISCPACEAAAWNAGAARHP